MIIWLIMIGLAIGTFLLRASFILVLGDKTVHPLIARALRFVPASVLSALVVPQILTRDGVLQVSFFNPQLAAGIVAGLIAWRTKNVLFTILGGMAVLWTTRLLIPWL